METPTGVPGPQHLCWLYMTSGRMMQDVDVIDWEEVYWHLPLLTMDEKQANPFQGGGRKWSIPDWTIGGAGSPTKSDSTSWICPCCTSLAGTMMNRWNSPQISGMNTQGRTEFGRKHHKLVMGPWPHQVNRSTRLGELDFGPQSLIDLNGLSLRWFDQWLKGEENGVAEEPPVSIFVMGENRWRQEQEWPLQRTRWTPFYLRSGGRANSRFGDGWLSTEAPGEEPSDRYSYDPANPVPFITDPTSSQIGGPDRLLRRGTAG